MAAKPVKEPLSDFSDQELELLGNLINIIAQSSRSGKFDGIYLTRLLKLLYLIDERSVMEIGVPVSPLEYNVAEKGPLAKVLWLSLQDTESSPLKNYVTLETKKFDGFEGLFITPKKIELNKKIFSEYELELIQKIIEECRKDSTPNIIDQIHEKDGSLWKTAVNENKISFDDKNRVSEFIIDFRKLVEKDEVTAYLFDTYASMK